MRKWTFRFVFWWALVWLFRLCLPCLAFGCWFLFQHRNWIGMGACAIGLLLAFGLQRLARRLAWGWVIDGNGERQKVEGWNRATPVFFPTTRSQRIVQEALSNAARRKSLTWHILLSAGLLGFAKYAWPNIGHSDVLAMTFCLAVLFGGLLLLMALAGLFEELLYQSGWQDMKGARVMDPEPGRPGLQDVVNQKVHGAGGVASGPAAKALLNPKR